MPRKKAYETTLPSGMVHTIQVQADRDDVDFNLVVRDNEGRDLARDESNAPGAEVTLRTGEEAQTVFITVDLIRGSASFSLRVSSMPTGVSAAFKEAAKEATATALTTVEAAEMVEAHNRWRQRYDTDPVEWSDELATYAQAWADELAAAGMTLRHRSPNPYGENLFWSKGAPRTPTEVVDAWGREEASYDHSQNNWWPKAGHFSQVIWKSTRRIGCGVARVGDQELWVCNYDPRGNWSGELPY